MNNDLIEKLSLLTLEKKYLKRELDTNWYDREKRIKAFNKIKSVDKEMGFVKFKIQLERKTKNENNNSN